MKLFQHRPKRLLPKGAYPSEMTKEQRDRADQKMRELLPLVPDQPGQYTDCDGELWTLNADGSWTDNKGTTRGPEWRPVIAVFGPMTPVPPADADHSAT
jgi:hypothetical protein